MQIYFSEMETNEICASTAQLGPRFYDQIFSSAI